MDGSDISSIHMNDQRVNFVEFRQSESAEFRRLHISRTVLLRVRSGTKWVKDETSVQTIVGQGEFVCLRGGEYLTIGNAIGDTGHYYSEGIILDDAIISDFLKLHPNRTKDNKTRKCIMGETFNETYTGVVESLKDPDLPERIIAHRVQELLLWVQEAGLSHGVNMSDTFTDRLRNLLGNEIDRHWKAPDAARELGMSEATLRRALSNETTSFTEQLRETRLSHALMRLQTTDQPLAEIAYESGFRSQSRLSEAFKSRFELTPGKIRSNLMRFDRIA